MPNDFITLLLTSLGLNALAIAGIAAALKWFGQGWLDKWIDARVREGVEKRLRELQLDLDKDLARHRSALEQDSEIYRSRLSREATDYAIFAQRRHEAIATLFATYLNLEVRVQSMSDLAQFNAVMANTPAIRAQLSSNGVQPAVIDEIAKLIEAGNEDAADRRMERILDPMRTARVADARATPLTMPTTLPRFISRKP